MRVIQARATRPARLRPALLAACSVLAFMQPLSPAAAQDAQPTANDQPATQQLPAESDGDKTHIVVIGQRIIIAALQDLEPEDQYDEDDVASYDANTVGEVLDDIGSENGDDQPSFLVNGQPVHDLGDVADLPVEAVQRIEKLPRGAAQRIGGVAGQRAYNIVLKPSTKIATVTLNREEATEGGWGQTRGEAILTYVHKQDRLNLTLRHSDSDILLESDRDLIPRPQVLPYSQLGNVIPFAGTEVDPLLSALAGQPVTIVALDGTPSPTTADLLAGANVTNPGGLSSYRSLRGSSRPYEASITGNKALAPWLSLSINGRLNWTKGQSLRGLPTGRFLVPSTNPYTPFSTPVFLLLNDPARPLESNTDTTTKSFAATFNANFSSWHASLVGNYNERKATYVSQLTGSFPDGFYTVDDGTNPFAGTLAGLIPVTSRTSTSRNIDRLVNATIEGPAFQLPAGPVQVRASAGILWTSYDANDFSGLRSFDRREVTVKGGVTIPLTGPGFLSAVGVSELALDIGTTDISDADSINRYSVAFNVSPTGWLRLTASQLKDGTAVYPELRSAPLVTYPNVPYYDPLRDETVDVQLITGGTAGLSNQIELTRSLSATATPLPKYHLQLSAEYQEVNVHNQLGALPEPSTAVMLAFPDRFVRDASGRLISVDTRSINFADERTNQLRLGVSFTVPLSPAQRIPRTATTPSRRIPGTNLQFNLFHTIILDSHLLIRSGLPTVDLLSGGAIGITGGKLRNTTSGMVSLSRGATGFRLTANYRGPSYLQTGTPAAPDLLTFGSVFKFDLRVFADLGQLMPKEPVAKGTRLSLVLQNIFNERQHVGILHGLPPLSYQPAYRDPVGRTAMLEIRKVF